MLFLPPIDYSPLKDAPLSTADIQKKLNIKRGWRAGFSYTGTHLSYSLTEEEIMRAARLSMFAERNGFHLFGNLPECLPFLDSDFYKSTALNYQTLIPFGIIMKLQAGWLEIGELRLRETSGRRNSHHYTYAKAMLEQKLPDLTLDSSGTGLRADSLGTQRPYKTESSEFNSHFKLYFGEEHALAGLKVLSPDVMATLIDHFSDFDIEMRGHTISYVTRRWDLTNPDVFQHLLETLTKLTSELSYQVRNPAEPGSLPADIESYKQLHGYEKQAVPIEVKAALAFFIFFMVLAAISFIIGIFT